ncbi:MAG: hypothetical protein LQ352_003555 [Teloschistes flavicans]|nr:MAG: hypothetical protein LQ352_003555 [Teloschistes flavicans]
MDQHNTPNQGAPVPPYEANPAYTQQPAIQHHEYAPLNPAFSYNSAPIQPYHGQQQSYPPQGPQHTPMSSPPLASEQKHEYYPNQQSQPGIPHQQQQHQQPVQLQQMQHPSQSGYQTAVPLANLQEAAAPVDCPSCRMRALTRTEYHSGGTTK